MKKALKHIAVQFGVKFFILVAVCFIVTATAVAQNHTLIIRNGASFSGTGKIIVKDSIKNYNPSLALNIHGTVVLSGDAQTLEINAGGGSLLFDTLSVRGNGEKRVLGTIAVAESLNVLAGANFDISSDTLRIGRIVESTGSFTTNENTVIEYLPNAGAEQTILGGVFKGKIRLAGIARKRLASDLTIDSLEHSGSGLTANHNLTVNGKAAIDTLLNVTSGSTIALNSDSSTIQRVANIEASAQIKSTNAALTINNIDGMAGTITGGTRQLTFVNPVTVNSGSIVAGSGDVDFRSAVTLGGAATIISGNAADSISFNSNLTFTSTTSSLQLTGSGIASLAVTPSIQTNSNLSLSENSTLYYSGADQTVLSLQYGTLGLVNSGIKQFASGEIGIRNTIVLGSGVRVDAQTNASIVNYNGTGSQIIAPLNYANLTLSNNHNNQLITLGTQDTIKVSGTFINTATNYTVENTQSVFEYTGSLQQTITPFSYYNLVLSGIGAKIVAATQTTYGDVEQKDGTPVTVNSDVDWTIEGSLIAGQGFVNNGNITIGSEL